jgi:hypothetical protein
MKLRKARTERLISPTPIPEIGSVPVAKGIDALILKDFTESAEDMSSKADIEGNLKGYQNITETTEQLNRLLAALAEGKLAKAGFEGITMLVENLMKVKTGRAELKLDDQSIAVILRSLTGSNDKAKNATDPELQPEMVASLASRLEALRAWAKAQKYVGGKTATTSTTPTDQPKKMEQPHVLDRKLLLQLLFGIIHTVSNVLDRRAWTLWDFEAVVLIVMLTCTPLWIRRLCAFGLACYLKASRRALVFAPPG